MINDEALSYIHSLLKFGIHPGLDRMDALLEKLGNPQDKLKFVHVAGTNGKGSVSTAVSNSLICAGYNVGLYTSPFVTDFLERVQFNGEPVKRELFADSTEDVKMFADRMIENGEQITEFEALTAAAFLCFEKLKCEIVVLEVGLGGRLDATNIIKTPLVNIITSLSLDHTAILGDTIEKIAFEKCGTLKDGGTVVSAYNQPEAALHVIEEMADKKHCELVIPDTNAIEILSADIFGTRFRYKDNEYFVPMPGEHQIINMTAVIEACRVLNTKCFNIPEAAVKQGIAKTSLPARTEVISKTPLVILDGGHNEDGAKAFYNCIRPQIKCDTELIVVAGMMADKAVESSLKPLLSLCSCFYAVTPDNPRAMNAGELANIAKKYCKAVTVCDNPLEAIKNVLKITADKSIVCVVGSLYLAGEVRGELIRLCERFVNN